MPIGAIASQIRAGVHGTSGRHRINRCPSSGKHEPVNLELRGADVKVLSKEDIFEGECCVEKLMLDGYEIYSLFCCPNGLSI
jgi:hypothetical protein